MEVISLIDWLNKMNEIKQTVSKKELRKRLTWLINLRWLAVIAVFIVITSTKYILEIKIPLLPFYFGNIVLLLYNIIFFFYLCP